MFPVTENQLPVEFSKLTLPKKVLIIESEKVFKNKKQWINEWLRASGF